MITKCDFCLENLYKAIVASFKHIYNKPDFDIAHDYEVDECASIESTTFVDFDEYFQNLEMHKHDFSYMQEKAQMYGKSYPPNMCPSIEICQYLDKIHKNEIGIDIELLECIKLLGRILKLEVDNKMEEDIKINYFKSTVKHMEIELLANRIRRITLEKFDDILEDSEYIATTLELKNAYNCVNIREEIESNIMDGINIAKEVHMEAEQMVHPEYYVDFPDDDY